MIRVLFGVVLCLNLVSIIICDPAAVPAIPSVPSTSAWNSKAWPFKKGYSVTQPLACDTNVGVLQNLLIRDSAVKSLRNLDEFNACYDTETAQAVKEFQSAHGLHSNDFDYNTAVKVVQLLAADHYRDDDYWPEQYQWKIHIPVHKDRDLDAVAKVSIRTDKNSKATVDLYMIAHTAGQYIVPKHKKTGNRNDLSENGATPSGLMTVDFVVPNIDTGGFGPFPINKAMRGLKGNAAMHFKLDGVSRIFHPGVRNGVYFHTGYWKQWTSVTQTMPESHGCVHVHPAGIKHLWDTFTYYGIKPTDMYHEPLQERGLISIEVIETHQQELTARRYKQHYLKQDNAINNHPFVLGGYDQAGKAQAIVWKHTTPDPMGPYAGAKHPPANWPLHNSAVIPPTYGTATRHHHEAEIDSEEQPRTHEQHHNNHNNDNNYHNNHNSVHVSVAIEA